MVNDLTHYWERTAEEDGEKFAKNWLTPQPVVFEFAQKLNPSKGKKILDIGCGMGRHTVSLAREGFDVTAFDGAPDAVEKTKEWLAKERLSAKVEEADFRTFDYGTERWDGILSINVIHHAYKREVRDVLRRIHQSLKPKGLFLCVLPKPHENAGTKVEPFTCIPTEGAERGVPHFYVTDETVIEVFRDFEIEKMADGSIPKNEWGHFVLFLRKRTGA